jgi:flagellar hook assembly protein FlgD
LSVSALRRNFVSRAPLAAAILAGIAMLATTSFATSVHAADATPHPLKAVFIVGPTNSLTASNLTDAEQLAQVAESYGMDVHRVFFPHATWENVLANIQGANLVVYMGHGYGWPSPYTKTLTESRQDGMGLNTFDGSGKSKYTYYGANLLRQYVHLAPNAIVFLNHLCYSAGNGEPGMAIPSYDLATQRVDNMASGWLATGAKTVFAYGSQLFVKALKGLMDPAVDNSMEDLFRIATPGHVGQYWGWVGWDARKYLSVRTPGATMFLDPSQGEGFYRAVTGDLAMKSSAWKAGPESPAAPNAGNLNATTDGAAQLVSGSATRFTPNGDGVTDTVTFSYTTNKETFVDWQVKNSGGTVVRNFQTWTQGGSGTATWDGKNDSGAYVADGTFTVTGTPSSRAGNAGDALTTTVRVLTTMANSKATPALFYPQDGDGLAPRTTMSVNLTQAATFTWVIVDKNNNVVRTYLDNASVGAGNQSWQWDGRNDSGAYVPDGTYYSVTTAATDAGAYFQRVALDARPFSLTPSGTLTRGTKVTFVIYSAEPLSVDIKKPKVKVTWPGVAAKTFKTTKQADGGFKVTMTIPAGAQPTTAVFHVFGTDVNGQAQFTDYTLALN